MLNYLWTDDSGQVVAVTNETVRYPIPVAARVLGLRSQAGDGSADGATVSQGSWPGFSGPPPSQGRCADALRPA